MRKVLCALVLLAIGGCNSSHAPVDVQPGGLLAGLPALSELDAPGPQLPRRVSATDYQSGDENHLSGGDVMLGGGIADLHSAAGELSWTIYRFDTADTDQLNFVQFFTEDDSGDFWTAISDFTNNKWVFGPKQQGNGAFVLDGPPGQFSNGAHTYVAVIAFNGDAVTLGALVLGSGDELPLPPEPSWIHSYGAAAGPEQWNGCIVDGLNNLVACGQSNVGAEVDFMFGVYSPDGTLMRARNFNGDVMSSYATDVEEDTAGNLVFAGKHFVDETFGPTYGGAWKFDLNGGMIWSKQIEGSGSDFMNLPYCALDNANNIYLGGRHYSGVTGMVPLIVKLSTDGDLLWSRNFEFGTEAEVQDLEVIGTTLYASFRVASGGGNFEASIQRIATADGTVQSGVSWPQPGSSGYYGFKLAQDGAGNLYWTASFTGGSPPLNGFYDVVRFDANLQPTLQFGFNCKFFDLRDSAVDDNGNHTTLLLIPGGGAQVVRFAPDGSSLHRVTMFNTDDDDWAPYGMQQLAVAGSGEVYMVGKTSGSGNIAGPQWWWENSNIRTPAVSPAPNLATGSPYIALSIEATGTISDSVGTVDEFGAPDVDAVCMKATFP